MRRQRVRYLGNGFLFRKEVQSDQSKLKIWFEHDLSLYPTALNKDTCHFSSYKFMIQIVSSKSKSVTPQLLYLFFILFSMESTWICWTGERKRKKGTELVNTRIVNCPTKSQKVIARLIYISGQTWSIVFRNGQFSTYIHARGTPISVGPV